MRANLEASHGLFFSQRLLLALVERGLPATTRTGSSSATRCGRGTRSSTSASSSAATRDRPTCRPRRLFALDAFTAHVDTVFERLRALVATREAAFMPDAGRISASGKVRELYALDDDRLLLVASDRISTYDVVLPTLIPDKGRVLTGLSVFWFTRTRARRPEPLRSRFAPTAGRSSASGSRCSRSRSSSAATSRARAGPTTTRRARSAAIARIRAAGVGATARPDRHACDEGNGRARPQHLGARGGASVRRRCLPRARAAALALYATAQSMRRSGASCSRTRSSSSGWTAMGRWCSGTRP